MNVEYINPFISSAVEVFATMLKCPIKRGKLSLSTGNQPTLDISGVVGLSGNASGTVVLSFSRDVATQATAVLLSQRCSTITSDVIDAVGELTNMIAGRAKSGLEHLEMTIALPTVVTGKNHVVSFGSATQTIRIPFTCEWGEFALEAGLVEEQETAAEAAAPAGEESLVE